ncbi:hypothetical protein [Luteibacter sp. E-22]|uniref:hypothetical protein n=1 Tax=Luteibacter sp. E-22 TaxID=3404050 RepID=UPI003CEC4E26
MISRKTNVLVSLTTLHFCAYVCSSLSKMSCKFPGDCGRSIALKTLDVVASVPIIAIVELVYRPPPAEPPYEFHYWLAVIGLFAAFINSFAAGAILYLVLKLAMPLARRAILEDYHQLVFASAIGTIWLFCVVIMTSELGELGAALIFLSVVAGFGCVVTRMTEMMMKIGRKCIGQSHK